MSRSLPHTLNSLQHGGEHAYNCPLRDDVCFEQSDRREIALTFCPYLWLVAQTQTAEWSGESAHKHNYLANSPLCQLTHQNMNKTTCHTLRRNFSYYHTETAICSTSHMTSSYTTAEPHHTCNLMPTVLPWHPGSPEATTFLQWEKLLDTRYASSMVTGGITLE